MAKQNQMLKKILAFYTKYFFAWVILCGVVAYLWPNPFQWAANFNPAVLIGLDKVFKDQSFLQQVVVRNLTGNNLFFFLTMFGIGAVLKTSDFRHIVQKPWLVLLGTASQFLIMPFGAYFIAKLFGFSPVLTTGLILTGAAPGAMSSNVMCYIAKADTAYSVSLTTASTLLCPLLTPGLTLLLSGEQVSIHFWAMFVDIMWMIIVPLLIGFGIRHYFERQVEKIQIVFPAISATFIIFICSVVIAANKDKLQTVTALILASVLILNIYGLAAGYGVASLFRLPLSQKRTLSIEIGMQNAGLGVVLAKAHLEPEAMIPAGIFVFVCIITASLLSEFWKRNKTVPRHDPASTD